MDSLDSVEVGGPGAAGGVMTERPLNLRTDSAGRASLASKRTSRTITLLPEISYEDSTEGVSLASLLVDLHEPLSLYSYTGIRVAATAICTSRGRRERRRDETKTAWHCNLARVDMQASCVYVKVVMHMQGYSCLSQAPN